MDSYLSHHGIPGQKWGVRRYQNYDGSLTPAGRERYGESKQLASQLFEKAKAHEPRITKDVIDSVNGTSAKMYGLEYKLKTEESLTRKIRTDSEEKKITPFDAASDIKDGVRYTALSPDNDFTSNYYKIKDSLAKKGYSEVRCKNYFDLYRQGQVKHKSVQSVFQSDDGYLFEMQFQTKASQDAKDKKVPIYEERRKPGLSKERQEALERQMVELAENVPDPKDVYKIKTHSGVKHSLGGDSMNYDELVHALFAEEPPEEDHLEHHGIHGQKWYLRRFQNEDGSLTPEGRRRYGVGEAREGSGDKPKKPGLIERYKQKKEEKRKAAEKAARVQKMKEGKARKAAERKAAEEHEAAKTKAIQSGNAEEVAKFRSELSYQELNDALNRIDLEKRLNERVAAMQPKAEPVNADTRTRLERATDLLDKYGNMANKVSNSAENFIKLYNTTAKVMNTFTDTDWPTIEKTSLKDKMEAAEKKRKESEAEEHKKWVDNLIKKNDPEEIDRNSDKLTNDELNAAIRRLNYNEQIQNKIKARNAATEETAEAAQETEPKKPEHLPGYEERKQKLAIRSEVRKELGKHDNGSNGTAAAIKNRNFNELVSNVMKDREEGKDYDNTNPDFDASNAWERRKTIRFSKRR